VSMLQERLIQQDYNYQVINASVVGDTTRGATARIDQILEDEVPDIAIIELGGNDGLRGLPVDEIFQNLSAIIGRLQEYEVRILLIPMQIPPNYGQIYTGRFEQVYENLAASHNIVLGQFILNNIGDNPDLMQGDGIHPKAVAQGMMLENVWPDLEPIIDNDESD